ncbi:hypothetical protein C8R44DRAFT_775635 [Mycena epipterygia]|nr:hypothetical protein C8R44DRAFT_775635 [Mycena epipterygia]
MLAGIAALAPSHLPTTLPRSHLPQHLTVPLRAPSGHAAGPPSYPTHALAISPSGKDVGSPHAIFPVHAVVLAAHCAALPRLPRPAHSSHASLVALSVLPLTLPSPQAFAILHNFMYTHRLAPALASLLPLPPAFLASLERPSTSHSRSHSQDAAHAAILSALASGTARHSLAAHLHAASGGSLTALMGHAGHVKELWQDMVALGLYDAPLWDALDLAWEVVLGALNLAAAQ